jgi:hypothetical protein
MFTESSLKVRYMFTECSHELVEMLQE